ncbi:hypothetical protein [Nonomuraea recticatena]|uniref:Uncharacterized protein n=1 Tax=Nonomuraea recticatena TaxID=46178 RepID=A0ABN3S0U8_9ACTN
MVARIRNAPGLPGGVRVSADMTAHTVGQRAVVVALEGGFRKVEDRLDAFRFSINSYASSKADASDLAFLIREFVLEKLRNTVHNGIAVSDVEEDSAPRDDSDMESREQRFIHRITIYLYEV